MNPPVCQWVAVIVDHFHITLLSLSDDSNNNNILYSSQRQIKSSRLIALLWQAILNLSSNVALRHHGPYGLLETGSQNGHLDFHTATEL